MSNSISSTPPMSVGLLVAAGFGRRFDPSGTVSKLETLLDGTMVAVRTAQALLTQCDKVIAAVRPESTWLAAALAAAGCEIALVTGEEGMGTSIACGARLVASQEAPGAVLVQPADMPWLDPASVRAVVQAKTPGGELIVVPTYHGRDGHPVRFDCSLLPDLSRLSGERGARRLLQRHPPHRIAVDDAGVVRDLDTPRDLRQQGLR